MTRNIFTTEWLVQKIKSCSADCKYIPLVEIPNEQISVFVTDLLHSALQEIFYSQEYLKDYEYETIFARYVNPQKLFDLGKTELHFEHVENEIPYFCTVKNQEQRRVVKSLPSIYEMCGSAFDSFFCDFVEVIRTFLGGENMNTYAIVRLISTNPNESFIIELDGDIRLMYYAENFPDGRYRTKDQ